ncbi:hypothetical protein J6590_006439 [Homalodisca vitripennis]|nr:hypothetical protein J6590_006439 [Homalodisca vitripennis]
MTPGAHAVSGRAVCQQPRSVNDRFIYSVGFIACLIREAEAGDELPFELNARINNILATTICSFMRAETMPRVNLVVCFLIANFTAGPPHHGPWSLTACRISRWPAYLLCHRPLRFTTPYNVSCNEQFSAAKSCSGYINKHAQHSSRLHRRNHEQGIEEQMDIKAPCQATEEEARQMCTVQWAERCNYYTGADCG